MTVTKDLQGAKLILAIEGRIDTTTAPAFEAEIDAAEGVTELVLDFTAVEYISSAALRVILKAQKMMNKAGSMKLTGVNSEIMEVLNITGFTAILTIE